MLKEDFCFSYEALAKMEDLDINFMKIDPDNFIDIARFYWACCDDKYTKEEILHTIMHGKMPITMAEIIDKYMAEDKPKGKQGVVIIPDKPQELNTAQISAVCSSLGITYPVYAKRPLKWTLGLIKKLMPKEKEKVTADELNNMEHVEVKLWQRPQSTPKK